MNADAILPQLRDPAGWWKGDIHARTVLEPLLQRIEHAETAYAQCDTKLKDALVEVERLRAHIRQSVPNPLIEDCITPHLSAD